MTRKGARVDLPDHGGLARVVRHCGLRVGPGRVPLRGSIELSLGGVCPEPIPEQEMPCRLGGAGSGHVKVDPRLIEPEHTMLLKLRLTHRQPVADRCERGDVARLVAGIRDAEVNVDHVFSCEPGNRGRSHVFHRARDGPESIGDASGQRREARRPGGVGGSHREVFARGADHPPTGSSRPDHRGNRQCRVGTVRSCGASRSCAQIQRKLYKCTDYECGP